MKSGSENRSYSASLHPIKRYDCCKVELVYSLSLYHSRDTFGRRNKHVNCFFVVFIFDIKSYRYKNKITFLELVLDQISSFLYQLPHKGDNLFQFSCLLVNMYESEFAFDNRGSPF